MTIDLWAVFCLFACLCSRISRRKVWPGRGSHGDVKGPEMFPGKVKI